MSTLKMPAINQVALAGRLVQDPELRTSESGAPRLSARLAVNRSYRNREGAWQEESSFFHLVAWRGLAEFAAAQLRKGTPVFVSGRLRSYSWKDEKDQTHHRVEVEVRNLQLLEKDREEALEAVEEELLVEAA